MIKISTLDDWPGHLGAKFESVSPLTVTAPQLDAFLQASGDDNACIGNAMPLCLAICC